MKKEELIKIIEDCPSSIFTNEDALKLLSLLQKEDVSKSLPDYDKILKRAIDIIDMVIFETNAYNKIEITDSTISFKYNSLELDSLSFDISSFIASIKNELINKI